MSKVNNEPLSSLKKTFVKVPVPEFPKKLLLGTQEDLCNLSCPKCMVFGTNNNLAFDIKKVATSSMSLENVIKILDEVKDSKPAISPAYFTEPLVVKNFKKILIAAKQRDIPVSFCTNGLLINESMAEFLADHMSVISVSIDATTKETLAKTRSTDRLETIKKAVFLLLEKRGSADSPRVGVNFTIDEDNAHEQEEFVNYWIQYVDFVRVNEMFTYEHKIGELTVTRERTPCREIYDQMIVDFNGEVRMCCLDGFRETNLGNVIEDGVYNVWHGEAMTAVRKHHEENDYREEPFCRDCTVWAGLNVTKEQEEGNLLLRSSDSYTYYNRLDRLHNWKAETKRNDLKFPEDGK